MKYLILVGDGMGDFPVAELDGKTPLYDSREQIKGSGQTFYEKSCTEYNTAANNSIDNGHEMIEKLFTFK